MPDGYKFSYAAAAMASLKQLPDPAKLIFLELQPEFTANPRKYPERMTTIDEEAGIYMYQHPRPNLQITYKIDEKNKCVDFRHFVLANFSVKETLFISYSHADADWLQKIKKFLSNLEQQGVVKILDDEQLQAGEEWRPQIVALLDSAKAAMLLVSQDFLASKFIRESELPVLLKEAQAKGKKIFWVHIKPSTVFDDCPQITAFQSPQKDPKTPLSRLSEPEQDAALVEISRTLSSAISLH